MVRAQWRQRFRQLELPHGGMVPSGLFPTPPRRIKRESRDLGVRNRTWQGFLEDSMATTCCDQCSMSMSDVGADVVGFWTFSAQR